MDSFYVVGQIAVSTHSTCTLCIDITILIQLKRISPRVEYGADLVRSCMFDHLCSRSCVSLNRLSWIVCAQSCCAQSCVLNRVCLIIVFVAVILLHGVRRFQHAFKLTVGWPIISFGSNVRNSK